MGTVVGACHICASPTVIECRFCGKPACGAHFDAASGACSVCAGFRGAN
ncbi:MAG: hypothetical protein V1934_08755 [Methanobacteriota archaeon]